MLGIEFSKNDEVFKSNILAEPWFDSEKTESNDVYIDGLLYTQHKELSSKAER